MAFSADAAAFQVQVSFESVNVIFLFYFYVSWHVLKWSLPSVRVDLEIVTVLRRRLNHGCQVIIAPHSFAAF
jgi:hypothetical protein